MHFEGELIGAPLAASGEMVFTTGMVGYSEAMTDASYFGQILVFTYPLIGNYGIPPLPKDLEVPIPRGFESNRVNAAAVIVTIDSQEAFHWTSHQPLDQWLAQQNVPGIVGLDTRHLVQLIRNHPGLLGRVVPQNHRGIRSLGPNLTPKDIDTFFNPSEHRVIEAVSTPKRRLLSPTTSGASSGASSLLGGAPRVKIGLFDCGVKWNIIRQLLECGCDVDILPWDTDPAKVICDGWLLSNGPGDPEKTGNLTERVAQLLKGDKPILGICLGHQILSLASGARTIKMPYGHRSHNQPVYEVGTRKGAISSQNHGYVVDDKTLPSDWEPWFRNANDQTIEGIRHKNKPFRSVQFHPEAAGGPRDTGWIIEAFVNDCKK